MEPNDDRRPDGARCGEDSEGADLPLRFSDDDLDVLIEVLGRRAYERMDPMDPRHEKFFEWLAREARLRQSPAERRETERAAEAFAARILRRVAAERATQRTRVRCVNEPPVVSPYVADGPAGVVDVRGIDRRRPEKTCAWDLAVAAGVGRDLWDEPPTHMVDLPRDVGDGRYVALTVAGDSMVPLLHTGDTILVRLGYEPAVDQVIVARHPEHGYVVKRVGRVDSMRLELTSLNDAYEPLQIPNDAALVLGTVVLRWCPHAIPPLPH